MKLRLKTRFYLWRSIAISQIFINLLNNAIDALDDYKEQESWIKIEQVSMGEGEHHIAVGNGGPKIKPEIAGK